MVMVGMGQCQGGYSHPDAKVGHRTCKVSVNGCFSALNVTYVVKFVMYETALKVRFVSIIIMPTSTALTSFSKM